MKFFGAVAGLEPGSEIIVLRFVDGRGDGYKRGYARAGYVITRRGEDFVEADKTIIQIGENARAQIFHSFERNGSTHIYQDRSAM